MSKIIKYKWSVDHTKQKGDSKMNTDRYLFTKNAQKQKPAGDHVHDLCRKWISDHPEIEESKQYERALENVLRYPGNQVLAAAYGRSPAELI